MTDKPVEIAERWKYLYNSPSEQNGHNLIFDELIEQLSAAEARVKELELCCYPHKCCDEHEEIGHCNSIRAASGGSSRSYLAYGIDEEQNVVADGFGCLKSRERGGEFEGVVAFQTSQSGVRQVEAHATLDSNNGSRRHNGVVQGMAVRRLTPEECEALQGFPRGYTKISAKTADGPRYKSLGNSMAVPCMRWIGERIQMVEDMP